MSTADGEAPIHEACAKFYIPFSNPDGGPQGRIQPLDNAVNAEYCEPFSRAGQLWPFLSFRSGILFDGPYKRQDSVV